MITWIKCFITIFCTTTFCITIYFIIKFCVTIFCNTIFYLSTFCITTFYITKIIFCVINPKYISIPYYFLKQEKRQKLKNQVRERKTNPERRHSDETTQNKTKQNKGNQTKYKKTKDWKWHLTRRNCSLKICICCWRDWKLEGSGVGPM